MNFIIAFILFYLETTLASPTTTESPSEYYYDETTTTPELPTSQDACLDPDCVIAAGSMLESMNRDQDPCTDFYDYACGSFPNLHAIPPGASRYTQFSYVNDIIERNLRKILEHNSTKISNNSAQEKAKNYYIACMDLASINRTALPWFKRQVDKLGGFFLQSQNQKVPHDWSLNDLLKRRNKLSLRGPFFTWVGQDDKNVSTNIIQLIQDGLGIGDNYRDYYLGKDVRNDSVMVGYTDQLFHFAELALGQGNVDRDLVIDVVEFEQKLANISLPQEELGEIPVTYFKTDVDWLQRNVDFLNWQRYFEDLFKTVNITIQSNEPILIYGPNFFEDLNDLMKEYLGSDRGKRTLQNYFVFQTILPYLPTLGGEFQRIREKFLEVLQGRKGSRKRWQICVDDTDSNVGFGLGAMYVDRYVPADCKVQMDTIVKDVIDALRTRLMEATWMGNATRENAVEKADALKHDVAYPDWLRNETYVNRLYSDLLVTDNYTANQVLSFIYYAKRLLRSLRQHPNPLRWGMTPQTVNAYYDPTQNKFVIPAGILNRPFFFKSVPIAMNYAAIGSVVGHEVIHGFDNIGREYDKYGNLLNWWTNATREQFNSRIQCLVEQYDQYVFNGLGVSGQQTLGENIADDAAIKASYQAYVKARREGRTGQFNRLVGVSLNDDQLFFVAWAQTWCAIYTEQQIRHSIVGDPHSLAPFRVNGPASNSPEFANAFNCPEGSPMNPTNKCVIW